ncbi:hypothetical protein OAH23_14130 [Verrucomicrobia bacterium]|nr:hypothetical protein [Verrucomicrobiota bacterium]
MIPKKPSAFHGKCKTAIDPSSSTPGTAPGISPTGWFTKIANLKRDDIELEKGVCDFRPDKTKAPHQVLKDWHQQVNPPVKT